MPEPLPTTVATPQTLSVSQKYCHACATVLDARAEICPRCGVRQQMASSSGITTTPSGKSRIVAALFAFFLGGLGVHKFYLGRIGMGILYLVFFWTFIPAVVALIESIVLFAQSDADFAAKYG